MDKLWKGIAIAGIWIGVGIIAFAPESEPGVITFSALFAMLASIVIAKVE